jgi:hypothetical protein
MLQPGLYEVRAGLNVPLQDGRSKPVYVEFPIELSHEEPRAAFKERLYNKVVERVLGQIVEDGGGTRSAERPEKLFFTIEAVVVPSNPSPAL